MRNNDAMRAVFARVAPATRGNLGDCDVRPGIPASVVIATSLGSRLLQRALATVLSGALLASPLHAAFQDDGWGARPVGMGGAFTAIADDASAPLYNPAGLVQVQWNEVSAMYAQLFTGLTLYSGDSTNGGDTVHLDESYLAYISKPIHNIGSIGISWANFNTTHLYREDTVSLSYARNVGDFVPVLDNSLGFGLNLKYLHRGISLDPSTVNDPVFQGGSNASAMTVDVGLLYKPEEGPLNGWRLGLAGKNLTQPNVGFTDVDREPMEWRLGLAYQSQQRPWLVPALDLVRRDGVNDAHAGLESWLFHDTLGLRAGVNRDEGAAGLSYYQAVNKNFGFRLDYGFTVPFYVEGTSGSHRIQATLYF